MPSLRAGEFAVSSDAALVDQLAARERPSRRPVMRQRWRDLLFLHWEWNPAELQRRLPPGLRLELWEGRAFLGVVPFFMEGVRPAGLPAVPGVSRFPEMNLRTYVRDEAGRTGVWFFSLDAGGRIAVWAARTFFHLPYFHARMSGGMGADGRITYRSRRPDDEASADFFGYTPRETASTAEPGTRDFFLIERYRLFAWNERRRRLSAGQVHHAPYRLSPVHLTDWGTGIFASNGFARPPGPPVHAVYSPGVDVLVYPLSRPQHDSQVGRISR